MKRLILVVFCAVATIVCSAQNDRIVNGAVFTADGLPLSTAVLTAVGTELTFTPAADGKFMIQIPYYVKMLEASAEGYLAGQVEIDGSYVVFKLKVDKKYLENKAKAEESARVAAAAKAKAEEAANAKAAEEARKAAEAKAKEEAAAKLAAEKEAAAKAKAEAEAKVRAEELAKKEAAAKAKAEEAARIAAEKEAAAKAKAEAEAKVRAEELARKEAEAKAKAEEAARIAAEKKAVTKAKKEARAEYAKKYNETYHNKGVVHNLEINYSFPITDYNTIVYTNLGMQEYLTLHPTELSYSIGYRFSNWVSLNLGTGITYDLVDLRNFGDELATSYYHPDYSQALENYSNMSVPVYLNAKFYMSRGKIQPILSASGGLYLSIPKISFQDMWLIDVGIGCNFRLGKRSNMYVMASAATVPTLRAGTHSQSGDELLWAIRQAYLGPRIKIGFTL